MTTFFMGQLSSSLFFAQIFPSQQPGNKLYRSFLTRQIQRILVLSTVLLLAFAGQGHAKTPHPVATASSIDETTYIWNAYIQLSCSLGEEGSLSMDEYYLDLEGFEGFSGSLSVNGTTVTFTLTGPSSTMPGDAEVAVITVSDPDCSGTQHFLVRTDGSGTILTLEGI